MKNFWVLFVVVVNLFLFNWRIIAFNIVLISTITWINLIYIYVPSLPPPTPSHPSRLSQSTRFEFPTSYSKFPLAVYFPAGNVWVSVLLSRFIAPSPSCALSTSLLSMSVFPLLPCRYQIQFWFTIPFFFPSPLTLTIFTSPITLNINYRLSSKFTSSLFSVF